MLHVYRLFTLIHGGLENNFICMTKYFLEAIFVFYSLSLSLSKT